MQATPMIQPASGIYGRPLPAIHYIPRFVVKRKGVAHLTSALRRKRPDEALPHQLN
jgi:hypothetical protein